MSSGHLEHEQNVGAYLLGALSELETSAFERHLVSCSTCQQEVERLRVAVEALPRSVTPLKAPPALKSSLMEAVRQDAAGDRAVQARLAERARGPQAAAGGDGLLARLGSALPRPRAAMAWVSAAFLLAVGIAAGYGLTHAIDDDGRVVAAEVDRERLPLASGSLFVADEGERGGILRLHGLPTLDRRRVYQVWIQRDGETIPQSLFVVGEDGTGVAAVGDRLEGADRVMVTREPAGGARAPSEPPVLSVGL